MTCEQLALDGLTAPFDAEISYRERVAGQARFLDQWHLGVANRGLVA